MKDQIIKKLENHDQQLETIASTVVDNQKKLEEHDKRFDQHDKRFDSMDDRLDTVARTVMDNQKQIKDIKETMATKQDIANLSLIVVDNQEQIKEIKENIATNIATKQDIADMTNTLDEIVGLVKKKDEEQIFMGVRVERVENDVKQIKPLVGLN